MTSHTPTGASRHYVLAAGGTGGHLIPAFALAAELHARGHHVALITDERGATIPGKPDFLPAHVLPAGRFGKNPLGWPAGVRAVLEGRRMALRLFEAFEPSAIVGFGGYPALPALLASRAEWLLTQGLGELAISGGAIRWQGRALADITFPGHVGALRKTVHHPRPETVHPRVHALVQNARCHWCRGCSL